MGHLSVQTQNWARKMPGKSSKMTWPCQASRIYQSLVSSPTLLLGDVPKHPIEIRLKNSRTDDRYSIDLLRLKWQLHFNDAEIQMIQFVMNLQSHDASAPVIRIVSFGFNAAEMPIKAGIMSAPSPSNSVLLSVIRFCTIETSTWNFSR